MRNEHALTAVRAIHTLVWLSIESCMAYLLYTGFARRSDCRAAVAGAVVLGECVVFAANGLRCPLTDVAESLGAEHGSVTDSYLPTWFARNLPAIHVPLLIVTVILHRRNLRHRKS
jgi:predicted benzoate:H+ symporter BenE